MLTGLGKRAMAVSALGAAISAFLWVGGRSLGATPVAATVIAVAFAAFFGLSSVLTLRRITNPTFNGRTATRALAGLWSLNLGFAAAAILKVWLDLPLMTVVPIGLVITVVAAAVYNRTTAQEVDELYMRDREVQPRTSAEARAMVEAARRAVAKPDRRGSRDIVAQLNLARALSWLSMLDRQPGALAEARAIIEALIADPDLSPKMRLATAYDLFGMVDSYAKETGDGSDYPAAMRIFEGLAHDSPELAPLVFEHRADYALFQVETALGDSGGPTDERRLRDRREQVAALLESAARNLAAAVDGATEEAYRLSTQTKFAVTDTQWAVLSEPEAARTRGRLERNERMCRQAVDGLGRKDQRRVFAQVNLLMCLVAGAEWLSEGPYADGKAASGRLTEAERVCRQALTQRTDFEPALLQLLSRVLAARRELGKSASST